MSRRGRRVKRKRPGAGASAGDKDGASSMHSSDDEDDLASLVASGGGPHSAKRRQQQASAAAAAMAMAAAAHEEPVMHLVATVNSHSGGGAGGGAGAGAAASSSSSSAAAASSSAGTAVKEEAAEEAEEEDEEEVIPEYVVPFRDSGVELDDDDRDVEHRVREFFDIKVDDGSFDSTVYTIMGVAADAERRAAEASASASASTELVIRCRNESCRNEDPTKFRQDEVNGDVVCTVCGLVNIEHQVHDGNMYRTFEGDADKSHHGPAPNSLFSSTDNLRTDLGSVQGAATKVSELRNIQTRVDLNLSNMGREDRRTRIGYKERQKRAAIDQIAQCCLKLQLGDLVASRSQEVFARFRDQRERIQGYLQCLAAAIIGSRRELRYARRLGSVAEEAAKRRQQQDIRKRLAERRGFQCSRCQQYYARRKDRDTHVCTKMTAAELKARDARVKARSETEKKKAKAAELNFLSFD